MTIERVLEIRPLVAADATIISMAFADIGWNKPAEQYLRYVDEERSDRRNCWVATMQGRFAGYVTLIWNPEYPGLAGTGIPEIQDLNVLPDHRRRGIATRLLDRAEDAAATRASGVGIGVGLHPGYNAAQRLYVKRGYVPDGLGVTHQNRYVQEGETAPFDDELVLHFVKELDVQSQRKPE
jgi:GNAT superfamily N-acetyltransferase